MRSRMHSRILDPARFHHLAAEYRTLAETRPTQKEKAELLDLATRLTALAELDLWKPRRTGACSRSARGGACSNLFPLAKRLSSGLLLRIQRKAVAEQTAATSTRPPPIVKMERPMPAPKGNKNA